MARETSDSKPTYRTGDPLIVIERREPIATIFADEYGDVDPLGLAFETLSMHVIEEIRRTGETVHGRFTFAFEGQVVELNMGDFAHS